MGTKTLWLVAALAVVASGYWWTTRPRPIAVESGPVVRGPMEMSITEQGETRAHDHYTLTAPVAGRLLRIDLHAGDRVVSGQTVATLRPVPLDLRSRAEAEARVAAAEALRLEAAEQVARSKAALELAQQELERTGKLWRSGDVPRQKYDQVRSAETIARRDVEAATYRETAAGHEVERARAALIAAGTDATPASIAVRSPAGGRVLRITEPSERILQPGEPLLTIGDSGRLEVVVDVLSSDAVKIRAGQPVWLEQWGGDHALRAVVQCVEPLGFTKVSALGVEEKRVPVRVDFVDPPAPLGDGYRVEARIILWSAREVVKVPSSAVFRQGEGWSVFVQEAGYARRREVKLGHRNDLEAEVLSGLTPGQLVVLHPPRELADNAPVTSL